MSCSVDILSWMDECYSEENNKGEDFWLSFNKDIKEKTHKTTFGKTNLSREGYRRYENPDIKYGYEILCLIPSILRKSKQVPNGGSWSKAKICCYDPNPNRNSIMFEVYIEGIYSYHVINWFKFKDFISSNKFTIKKII